ncbi:TIGR01777 family oxidoreductase [Mucilaginibacter sp. UR6-11]|uniref:TIGR01777 family oxidoreductase n=1 Tax=Mucilaginibacter sp. UR6-11 TaxID=1435644 RepID=UPI001E415271|nr:TIGR01777 family oxidoreductase [Mucilaginibacter sp. UR6-11]MCC8425087.1 TIGR01777 family oxidoreductase [Mucilaginibacter sp. UR6-11]
MSKHILLTGGTGLVGRKLTELLLDKGYRVSHLSRKPGTHPNITTYLWDVNNGEIDEACIDGVDTIVHLAGAGVADSRWTAKRKEEIIKSRTKSIGLIYKVLKSRDHQVTSVVSASATGYYGDRADQLLNEDSAPGTDFLANCCLQWEHAVDAGESLGLRIVKFRTGVVLDATGGALAKLAGPVKFGFGSPLGNGKQWIPWIHERDVIRMYLYGIENENLTGDYNMVAPNPVTNKQLTKAIAGELHRPLWLPKVPAFALKLILGEMSAVVLNSTKVSAQKIEEMGFKFQYPTLMWALKEIYK